MAYHYSLSGPIGHRATLGLIALQTDETLEHDLRRMLPIDGVALYTSRVPVAEQITGETLIEMEQTIPTSAALLPKALTYDVVAYGCTSGSSVIGSERVVELVKLGAQATNVTNPVTALSAACAHLSVSKLAFLSPYVEEVSQSLRTTLQNLDIESPVFGSFDEPFDQRVARIDAQSVINAALDLGRDPNTDAVFMSCTNLQTLDVIDQIETEISKPVLSSNQVLAWHMAQLSGITLSGPGRLLS